MQVIINTREDLDAIKGTPEYDEFMNFLKGSMTRKVNIQIYPENYNNLDYDGEILDTIWVDVEDLTTIEAFGFKKADFE